MHHRGRGPPRDTSGGVVSVSRTVSIVEIRSKDAESNCQPALATYLSIGDGHNDFLATVLPAL